ncbi:type II secretion system F family protein [Lentzea sp. JNUCC 0626]|uniref:type II secretion system F family protein n=1 Tax=Lentzea sp. JNUCC 0626 TaxID=3367513 RepID=UPI003747F401
MIDGLIWGAGLGLGLWGLLVWTFPPRPALHVVLGRLNADSGTDRTIASGVARFSSRGLRANLAVVDKTSDAHFTEKVVLAGLGLLLPATINGVLAALDAGRPWTVTAAAAIGLGAAGFWVPDLVVTRAAARRRTTFRHALGAYFNLVRVLLAGGTGIDSALTAAAGIGSGWAFRLIRQELLTAHVTRTTPWQAFGRLGEELNERVLRELAASISLTGSEGAKIRASLAARAAALRIREAAEAEGNAHAATERMTLPVVLLLAGFLLFIGYPATISVLNGL